MNIQHKTTAKQTSIKISGDLTIFHAAEAKAPLLQDIDKLDRKVTLDLKDVTELDTAGVQLLLMLKKRVQAQGGTLKIAAHSAPVDQVLAALNLDPAFTEEPA